MTQLSFVGSRLETQFYAFHAKAPWVYSKLVQLARSYRERHPAKRAGIAMFYEYVRWTVFWDTGDTPKLSNNHRAFYARLIDAQEPDLQGLFRFKRQRIQSTFGPSNIDLDPNVHL